MLAHAMSTTMPVMLNSRTNTGTISRAIRLLARGAVGQEQLFATVVRADGRPSRPLNCDELDVLHDAAEDAVDRTIAAAARADARLEPREQIEPVVAPVLEIVVVRCGSPRSS